MAGKRCPGQGCPKIIASTARYCPTHQAAYEAKRGSATARGYGAGHQRLRAAWRARIDGGERVMCSRCGAAITVGMAFDLGHTPDRAGYSGPECPSCNRSEGGARGSAARRQAEA